MQQSKYLNFNKNFYYIILFSRVRLAEVQDEYEEREKRWNRIASLIDREDLISNSSSTTSMIGSQYLTGSPNTSLNNGSINNVSSGD
jgi:hypothetical protein